MSHRIPWTREQLNEMIPKLDALLAEAEASQEEEVKPMPPMTYDECFDFLLRLMDAAGERPLTQRECFMHGQLLAVFEQQVIAKTLGFKQGRYYVIPEEKLNELLKEERHS